MNEVYKIAAWVPISVEIAEDIDRIQRPWRYPDLRVLPKFDLFPRWTKLVNRYREARRRIVDARLALHGRLRDEEDSW